MLNKIRKQTEGFTIIEVLIVLAIAALILLIVFLAVPALQRNQRNTSRKNDVARIGGAVTEFVSNNSGKVPANGDGSSTNGAAIVTSAGDLGQYDFTAATGTPGNFVIRSYDGNSNLQLFGLTKDKMIVVTKGKCLDKAAGTVQAGSDKQIAIQYATETTSAQQALCVDI